MFKKLRKNIDTRKEEIIARREEEACIARERAEEEERKEKARLQADKNALMALSEKELMVEAIIALRGYSAHITNIERQQSDLMAKIGHLELDVSALNGNVYSLRNQ